MRRAPGRANPVWQRCIRGSGRGVLWAANARDCRRRRRPSNRQTVRRRGFGDGPLVPRPAAEPATRREPGAPEPSPAPRRSTATLRRRSPPPTGAVAATAAADPRNHGKSLTEQSDDVTETGREPQPFAAKSGRPKAIKSAPTTSDHQSTSCIGVSHGQAVILMMRRTVADGVRMCTGLAAPSKTGPMAIPPPPPSSTGCRKCWPRRCSAAPADWPRRSRGSKA